MMDSKQRDQLIEAAIQKLEKMWSCTRNEMRLVKGDDRILVYRRSRYMASFPDLPDAALREDALAPMLSITYLDIGSSRMTTTREYVVL